MNHYLIFSAINDCFKEISSLDAGRLFSVYVSDDGITEMIKEEVFVHRLPEYYDQHKGNTGQFDIQQDIDEAVRRGYHAKDLGIAEKHISEVLKKYLPKGIVGMSEVKYAC